MAMSEYIMPEPVQEFYKKKKMAEQIVYSREMLHKKAFMHAAEILKNEKNLYNPEKIMDKKVQSDLAERIVEFYKEAAKQEFGFDADNYEWEGDHDGDPKEYAENHVLKNLYLGIERSDLAERIEMIASRPFEFNEDKYLEVVPDGYYGMGQRKLFERRIHMAAADHITPEDIPEIYDHLNRDGALDGLVNPDALDLGSIVELLNREYDLHRMGITPTQKEYADLISANPSLFQFRQEQPVEEVVPTDDMIEQSRVNPELTMEDISRSWEEFYRQNKDDPHVAEKFDEILDKQREDGRIGDELWDQIQDIRQRQEEQRRLQQQAIREQLERQQPQALDRGHSDGAGPAEPEQDVGSPAESE